MSTWCARLWTAFALACAAFHPESLRAAFSPDPYPFPNAMVGVAYTHNPGWSCAGATPSYAWGVSPHYVGGLTLGANGTVIGVPYAPGTYLLPVTVTFSNAACGSVSGTYILTVLPATAPPTCRAFASTTSLPPGGGTVTVWASCDPAATQYVWTSPGRSYPAQFQFSTFVSETTTFTVVGSTTSGASAPASVTVAVAPAPTSRGDLEVVEFYHPGFDHYFISASASEIAALDNGTHGGWIRSGRAFRAFSSPLDSANAVCRFYIPPAYGDSHFYSASPAECADVKAKFPQFVFESAAVMYMAPSDGSCRAGLTPVYRLWNKRADSNHRYVVDKALRDRMVAAGYVAEGFGPNAIIMCSPNDGQASLGPVPDCGISANVPSSAASPVNPGTSVTLTARCAVPANGHVWTRNQVIVSREPSYAFVASQTTTVSLTALYGSPATMATALPATHTVHVSGSAPPGSGPQPGFAASASLGTTPPQAPFTVDIGVPTNTGSFELEFTLGNGLRYTAPAAAEGAGRLRGWAPPGRFGSDSRFGPGAVSVRVKRIYAKGKQLDVDYSVSFSLEIGAMPVVTRPPGELTRLLVRTANAMRKGTPNRFVEPAVIAALRTTTFSEAVVAALSPAELALSDQLALAYFQNALRVNVSVVAAPEPRAFGDPDHVEELARQIAAAARANGQIYVDVGESLMTGAAIVAAIVEAPAIAAGVAAVGAIGGMMYWVGLAHGTSEGLVLDAASHLATTEASTWAPLLGSIRFFAENSLSQLFGGFEDRAIVDRLGVPSALWDAVNLVTQTSPTAWALSAISTEVEAYVAAHGTPAENALLAGDKATRELALLTGPGASDLNVAAQRAEAALGILASYLSAEDPRVPAFGACYEDALTSFVTWAGENVSDHDWASLYEHEQPELAVAFIVLANRLADKVGACHLKIFESLTPLSFPRFVEESGAATLSYFQSAVCFTGGCDIVHTTCDASGCSSVTQAALCAGGFCQLSAPPLCPPGFNYAGAADKCVRK